MIVVNGKSWPRLDVEPRRYRFRFLNGSNARFYNMTIARAFESAGVDPVTGSPVGVNVTSAGPVFSQSGPTAAASTARCRSRACASLPGSAPT